MPAIAADYDVLLQFTNDTRDCASVQLARDFHSPARNGASVLLLPGEHITLILAAGSTYQYVLKTGSKVASLSITRWRDATVPITYAFAGGGGMQTGTTNPTAGITVDRIWRDYRFMLWDEV